MTHLNYLAWMPPWSATASMNNRYFACATCCRHTDAGYRWAYWTLEHPGTVSLGAAIDPQAIQHAAAYWDLEPDSDWLEPVHRTVRRFLVDHQDHEVLYVESEYLYDRWELGYEWREIKST